MNKGGAERLVAGAAVGFFGAMYVLRFINFLAYGVEAQTAEEAAEKAALAEKVSWHQRLLGREGFAPGFGLQPSGALGVEGTAEYWAEMEAGSIEAARAAAAAGAAGVPGVPGVPPRPLVGRRTAITDPTAPRIQRIQAMDVRIPAAVRAGWTPAERRGGVSFKARVDPRLRTGDH